MHTLDAAVCLGVSLKPRPGARFVQLATVERSPQVWKVSGTFGSGAALERTKPALAEARITCYWRCHANSVRDRLRGVHSPPQIR